MSYQDKFRVVLILSFLWTSTLNFNIVKRTSSRKLKLKRPQRITRSLDLYCPRLSEDDQCFQKALQGKGAERTPKVAFQKLSFCLIYPTKVL